MTRQDGSSVWASVSSSCGVPGAAYSDFQMLARNAASYVSTYVMSGGQIAIPIDVRSFNYGKVNFSVWGLPSGVSASFSSWSIYSGTTKLTLKASSSAKYQTVPITIFGISGSRVHSITLMIGVRPS